SALSSLDVQGAVGPGSFMLRLSSSDVQGAVDPGSFMLRLSSSDMYRVRQCYLISDTISRILYIRLSLKFHWIQNFSSPGFDRVCSPTHKSCLTSNFMYNPMCLTSNFLVSTFLMSLTSFRCPFVMTIFFVPAFGQSPKLIVFGPHPRLRVPTSEGICLKTKTSLILCSDSQLAKTNTSLALLRGGSVKPRRYRDMPFLIAFFILYA
ncbi:hypothetical protein L9F63_004436, partial [Diploptera punctata]